MERHGTMEVETDCAVRFTLMDGLGFACGVQLE